MDEPILKFKDEKIGLRKIGDNLYEPKSFAILEKVVNGHSPGKGTGSNFFTEAPVAKKEPEFWYKIESFCFVATENIKEEAAVLIKSLRKFHQEPIYIICDQKTRQFLNKERLTKNVEFRCGAEKDELEQIQENFKNHKSIANDIHKPDCIFKKMQAMEFALEFHENTFFLDSDIIVLDNLQEFFQCHIVLSPHYYPKHLTFSGFEYGFYNAGYLFCARKGFPKFWRQIYLEDSIFFEQECMNRIPNWYNIQTFDREHNVGFWRRDEIPEKIKSLHFHTKKKEDDGRNLELKKLSDGIKEAGVKYMMENGHEDTVSYINKLNKPKKIAFIHYGKTAGVYVNKYFKKNIVRKYNHYMSWDQSTNPFGISGRDWSEEELSSIAQTKEETCYITNHHINWNMDTVKKFKENGWFTFMFIRRPEELLCSLFHWAHEKDVQLRHGIPNPDTLEEIFELGLTKENFSKLWILPDYTEELDYVAEFNDSNFGNFVFDYFGANYIPGPRENTSKNKGFCHYRVNGDISDERASELFKHPEYKKYLKYLS